MINEQKAQLFDLKQEGEKSTKYFLNLEKHNKA